MEVPFALSIHKFVNSVGADAGFAAFVCVAVIGLLYFAQARETATLRERLQDAHERIGGLESRIAQLMHLQSTRQAVPQAVQAAAPGRVTPPPPGARAAMPSAIPSVRRIPTATATASVAATLIPFAPYGIAAPALASATKLIPDPVLSRVVTAATAEAAVPGVPAVTAVPVVAGVPAVPAGSPATAGAPVTVAAAATAVPADAASEDTIVVPGGAVTVAANGKAETPAPEADAAPPAAVGPTTGVFPRAGEETAPPRVQIGAGSAAGARTRARRTVSAPARPLGEARFDVFEQDRAGSGSRLRGRRLPLTIATVAAVVIVGGLIAITQSGNSTSSSTVHGSGTNPTAPKKSAGSHKGRKHIAPPFSAANVTVAVLNGTDVGGLAADVSKVLSSAGYKPGSITNAASQTQTTTIVYFMPGAKADAQHVARQLKLSPGSVQAATQTAIQACATTPTQTTTSCSGDVIVSVGQDKASLASSASGSAG